MNKAADRMPLTYNLGTPFEIWIPDRSEWINGLELEREAVTFWTDGSKTEVGVGFGILNLSKADTSTLTGLLTRHCRLKRFLAKINRANSSSCRLCDSADEMAAHILCECFVVSRTRLRLLGKCFLVPSEVKFISTKQNHRILQGSTIGRSVVNRMSQKTTNVGTRSPGH